MEDLDFDRARRLGLAHVAPTWTPEIDGELYVAPYGAEDDTHFRVIVGAREALVDGNFLFERMDAPVLLVDKVTGEVLELTFLDNLERLGAMKLLGHWPE